MSLYDSDQKIGIELELYCNGDVDGAGDFIYNNSLRGLEVTDDGSLDCDGAEIKFDGGIPLRDAQSRIEAMYMLATDTTSLYTYFGEGDTEHERGYCGDRSDIDIRRMSGETGLHIHFGMPEDGFRALDILRLLKNVNDDIINVRKKAWRINERWGGAPLGHLSRLQNGIERALRSPNPEDVSATTLSFDGNKYTGVNLNNVGSDYMNTVEFRFGHGALMANREAFEAYLGTLKSHWENSITGERTMVWGNLLFKEITPRSLTRRKAIRVFNNETGEDLGKFRIQFNG